MRKIIIKTIPYLLAFAGGIVIYLFSIHQIHDDNLTGLISNVAASLIAIPLMFLLYDYSNYKLSRKLSKTLFEGFSFEINSCVLKLLRTLRQVMGVKKELSWAIIENMLDKKAKDIKNNLKITAQDIELFKLYKKSLDEMVYKAAHTSVLGDNQIKYIADIGKNLSHIINEHEFRGGQKSHCRILGKYTQIHRRMVWNL
ncbi:MAG TPA: hypothetical protein PKJ33_02940 [Alphaproteobacteria bacterium]|nr:hypothetical protein [Alphaproteobacteria bacterium]